MVTQQQQTAELSLNPPDLGPLHVVLSIDNDQASVMFMSHNADVRQTLEGALPRLRELMADSGISLGSTTVSADNAQQRGWADESGSGDHNGAPRIRGGGMSDPSGSSSLATTIGGGGLVDIFADVGVFYRFMLGRKPKHDGLKLGPDRASDLGPRFTQEYPFRRLFAVLAAVIHHQ
jgi:hypothetical protein